MSIDKFTNQQALFAEIPSRVSLSTLDPSSKKTQALEVNVWRNHAVEPILELAKVFANFGGLGFEFRLSDYDDSFGFTGYQPADCELIWLEPGTYSDSLERESYQQWFLERLQALRRISRAPIIAVSWTTEKFGSPVLDGGPSDLIDTHFVDLAELATDAGIALLDARTAKFSGSPVNSKLYTLIARELACRWISGAVLAPLKAIVLDLDNTLHTGVLGEDSATGVTLSAEQKALQSYLKELSGSGIFLALCSRNSEEDVVNLFAQRTDYPLDWDDFAATRVSWNDKATSIKEIAAELRIATDAIMFVDDNIGELLEVAGDVPDAHLIHAGEDARITKNAISYYPGLWRWQHSETDFLRVKDLLANKARERLTSESGDQDEYYHSLGARIELAYDDPEVMPRCVDLSAKTNQFNLSFSRFSASDISERTLSEGYSVISIKLADRLSDSGIIGLIVAASEGTDLLVEEVCLSCRALGRQLEDAMLLEALKGIKGIEAFERIQFRYARGERNEPALNWLKRVAACANLDDVGTISLGREILDDFLPPESVTFKRGNQL